MPALLFDNEDLHYVILAKKPYETGAGGTALVSYVIFIRKVRRIGLSRSLNVVKSFEFGCDLFVCFDFSVVILLRKAQWDISFIAQFCEEREDCEPEGSFFSQISPHLKPDTIRKIHTLPLNFQFRIGFQGKHACKMCMCIFFGACLAAPWLHLLKLEKRSFIFG